MILAVLAIACLPAYLLGGAALWMGAGWLAALGTVAASGSTITLLMTLCLVARSPGPRPQAAPAR